MELIDFCRISSDTKYKKNMKINFGCNMKTYGKKIWEPNEPIQFFIREAEMCLDNNLLCYNESQKNLRHCGNLPSYIGLCSKWQYYDRIWVHLFDPSPTPTPTHTHKTHTHTHCPIPQCCAKDSISALLLKFNIVLGGWRHVISFTNIT